MGDSSGQGNSDLIQLRIEDPFAKAIDVCLTFYLVCLSSSDGETVTSSAIQHLVKASSTLHLGEKETSDQLVDAGQRLCETYSFRMRHFAIQQCWDAFIAALQDTIKGLNIGKEIEASTLFLELDRGLALANLVKSKKVDEIELNRLSREFDLPLLREQWFQDVAVGIHRLRNHVVHRMGFIDLSYAAADERSFTFTFLHGGSVAQCLNGDFSGFFDDDGKLCAARCTIEQGKDGGRRSFVKLQLGVVEDIICSIMYMTNLLMANATKGNRKLAHFATLQLPTDNACNIVKDSPLPFGS